MAVVVGVVAALALGAGAGVQAITAVPPAQVEVTASFVGFVDDRVSAGEVLEADGTNDAVYAVNVAMAGSHTIVKASISSGLGSVWDTDPNEFWIVGITNPTVGAAFLNTTAGASIPFTDGRSLYFFMADDGSQAAGTTFFVEVCVEDSTCDTTEVTTGVDADGDGWNTPADCDDADDAVNPDATEVPDNSVDENCDGVVGTTPTPTWYPDGDGDTYGDPAGGTQAADPPSGYVADNTDCDDSKGNVNPGAGEALDNGVDEDCDGYDLKNWWADADSDTYGNGADNTTGNTAPSGYVGNHSDCDDTKAGVHPGATELVGNGVDEDCDGSDAKLWHPDADSDTYGDESLGSVANTAPSGYVADGTDCDDGEAGIHPGATETADNTVDEDCDGADATVWYPDGDGDTHGGSAGSVVDEAAPKGYVASSDDCDDENPNAYPGATETANNGVDEDCDGADLVVSTNHAPVAADNSAQVDENDAAGVDVVMQATDEDDDDLTLTITGGPSNGTLDPVGAVNCSSANTCSVTLHYTPGADFSGSDVITFSATDPSGASSTVDGVITITVKPLPAPTSFGTLSTSNGYFTNKGTEVTISSTLVSADAACLAKRTVTATISGGALASPLVKTARTNSTGGFGVKATLQPGTYSVALSTPAAGDCAGASSDPAGSFVIRATKKPK